VSRIGKKAIAVPGGVTVQRGGREIHVKGPKGSLAERLPAGIGVEIGDGEVRFTRPDDRKETRAHHGLARALVANMVTGVTAGFRRELQIEGVGYRAEVKGRTLTLQLGYSHPVVIDVPEGLEVSVEGTNRIRVAGIDRRLVGHFASELRAIRPPEPYKGKGIRYTDERIRRKVGKAGAAG
jgi:large subunit ribosomal protein L6